MQETIVRKILHLSRQEYGQLFTQIKHLKHPPSILACGGEQKNTFAMNQGQDISLSPHLGDLKSPQVYNVYLETIQYYKKLLQLEPELLAHDLHPDYLSTQYALSSGLPTFGVQHHHAHIAGVMGEHGLIDKVIGIAWDGSGYGADGYLWGGEFLLADYHGYQRWVHFKYLPLPGGDAAVRQPWRVGLSWLYQTYGEKAQDMGARLWPDKNTGGVLQMLERRFNCPESSSCGRLFDALSAILGICHTADYEGQGAILLQNIAATSHDEQSYPWRITDKDGCRIIDSSAILEACTADTEKGVPIADIARRFHNSLAQLILQICINLRKQTGCNQVALSGGVFQNELLLDLAVFHLKKADFATYLPMQLSCNDSGLSFGQLLVAAANL